MVRTGPDNQAVGALVASLLAACNCAGSPRPCATSDDCADGHACEAGECAAACSQALCAPGSECVSRDGNCLAVECGEVVRCGAAGRICDVAVHSCFPSSGACAGVADCPPLVPESLSRTAVVSCEGGFCRLRARPQPRIAGLDGPVEVTFETPSPGQAFSEAGDLRFAWSAPAEGASIVVVLRGLAATQDQMPSLAVWGIVLGPTASREARVAEGHEIAEGEWLQAAGTLPAGTSLHAVAQLFGEAGLLGSSAPVPFVVGGGWPDPGAACSVTERDPTPCFTPARPQECRDGTCVRLCASDLDCPAGACGGFQDGQRACE